MSDVTKKVVFEGVDLFSGVLKNMTNAQKQLYSSTLELGNKYSQTSSGTLNFLNKELEARKKLVELQKQQKSEGIRGNYDWEKSQVSTSRERKDIEELKQRKLADVEKSSKTELDLIESVKKTNEILVSGFHQTIAEDRESSKRWYEAVQKGKVKYEGLSEEDKLRYKVYQEELGGKASPEKQGGHFWSTMWGTLGGNLLSKSLDRLTGVATATTGEHALASFMGGIPIVGGMASAIYGRHIEAVEAGQAGRYRYRSITGRNQGVSGVGYGFTGGETGMYGAELALSRGSASNLGSRLVDQMALERAYGLDKGSLLKLSKGERFGGGSSMSTVTGLIRDVGKEMFKGGDFSRLPELLEIQNNLQEQQLDILGSIDNKSSRSVMGSLVELGEKYSMSSRYQQGLQSALTEPKNEYQRARQLSVLSRLSPGASRWQLMEQMEGGMFTPGYMSGVLGSVKEQAGTGEPAMELLFGMLEGRGWNRRDVRTLWDKYQSNPQIFDKAGSDDELKDVLGIRQRGKKMTPPSLVEAAGIEGAYEQGAFAGFGAIMKEAAADFKREILDGIGDFFSSMAGDFWGGSEDSPSSSSKGTTSRRGVKRPVSNHTNE